jgi:autotransporter-associated beta strand protein
VALPLSSSGDLIVRGQSATATNVIAAAQAYSGSTRLELGTLTFEGEGTLPAMTDLTVVHGTLHVTNRTQSVRTLALGTDGANATIGIHVTASPFTPFIARSGFSAPGTTALAIRLDGVTADGTYPVLDVPAANRTALVQLAARSTLSAALPANSTASLNVVTANGRALLVANVESTPDDPPPQDDPAPVSPPLPFDSDLVDEYVVQFGPTHILAGTTTISNGVTLWQDGAGGTVSNLVLGTTSTGGTVILDVDASARTGLTVLGTLDIRTPVAVRAHTGTQPFMCGVMAGTYTALVYRATQMIDLSQFVTPTDANVASVSYAEVTLGDGWKALVATITAQAAGAYSMGVRAWSETTTGGKWHSAANWTGWSPPDAAGAVAGFRPAQAANVPVTLAKSATVGTLVLSGASGTGYHLTGERLALNAAGTIPAVTAETGAHEIAAPLALAARTVAVDTSDGASVALTGNLSGTNVALRVNRGRLSGGGTVTLGGTTNEIEKLSAGCGCTVVSDLSFATAADALRLGGGTLRYEGPDISLPGLILQGGNGRAGVLDVPEGRMVSIRSMTANATAFIKVGGGDLKLSGRGTFALGAAVSNRTTQANTYIRANGDAPISTYRKGNVSQGRIVQGTVGDPSDAPVVSCSDFCVGVDSVEGEDCEYVMNNGILNAAYVYVDYYHGVTRPCRGQFTLNGGAVTSKWVRLGQTGSGPMYARPAVVVNGGRWRVTGPFTLGYQKASPGATDCSVTINGGELDIVGTLLLGRAGANTGMVHLCGGVLRAENIVLSNGTGRVYFDGGTYAPYCAATANRTLAGLTAAYIGAGGLTIDLSYAGGAYTVTQPLLHDAALSGADGGLRVVGGGTLVLAGSNTYAGPTVLDGSTLDLSGRTAAVGRLEGSGGIRNGTLAVTDVLRPGGSGKVGTMHLDTSTTITGIVEVELGDRIFSAGTVDVTDATLLVTDLNRLQKWNSHLLIDTAEGVQGTFDETNLDGSGYRVLNTGKSVYVWNGSMSVGTTIFVR